MTDTRILIGEVGAPHGVNGAVRVKVFTAEPLALRDYKTLTAKDGRVFTVVNARVDKTVVVTQFAEVDDRTAAEALKGTQFFADRAQLPENNEPDSFYYADLVGLDAVSIEGAPLGTVIAVHDFGAGDLLDVETGIGPSVLVPFTQDMVPEIDMAGGCIVIDASTGLFEPPKSAVKKRRRSPRAKAKSGSDAS